MIIDSDSTLSNQEDQQPEGQPLQNFAAAMKRDWNDRARENAKWYINTVKKDQSDEEFDSTGRPEVQSFVLADPVLTKDRDLKQLRLLEIGCGIGRMTKRLAEAFGEVHATDVSAEMIAQARERMRDYPNVFLYETSGVDFAALPENYFDLIFSVYVFQHVPDISVIHSNIRDACRTLKPGGLFKFQVCGIDHEAYARMPKDTWTGTAFTDAEIRRAARENDMKLMSVLGYGTQYCWVIMRKPFPEASARATTQPKIEFFGRSDSPETKAIPTNGDYAYLTLLISGVDQNEADANGVAVEINGQEYLPLYAGWVGEEFAEAVGDSATSLTQISLGVTPKMPRGRVSVRIKTGAETSDPVMIDFLAPQPIIPRINLISNAVDGGVDVHAQGEKALFRVFASGLDDTATPDNVRVHVRQYTLNPISVSFIPANGVYMTVARMPEDLSPGEAEIKLQFGDLVSAPVKTRIS
jgi:2-polyprenyl-3-methyl-5-hydroxy-6-metoxy-1,4-benzoquinol methylase